jgi:ketosteroid isomerase-like protein
MRHSLLVVLLTLVAVPAFPQSESDTVVRADEAWQQAKRDGDVPTMERLLADDFYEMNQNGNGYTKAAALDLWRNFRVGSLTTESRQVRVIGDTASVTGTQTEFNGGVDRMLFLRVYIRRGSEWRLLSSMQFRNPKDDERRALLR